MWKNALGELTDSYNKTKHTSIGMAPADVRQKDERRIWEKVYNQPVVTSVRPYKFKVGDVVRLSAENRPFQREYDELWTREYFFVKDRFRVENINKYRIKDYDDEEVKGTFYENELQEIHVDPEQKYYVEKILKRRSNAKRQREVLVKWEGE
jgi:hypothetical protein